MNLVSSQRASTRILRAHVTTEGVMLGVAYLPVLCLFFPSNSAGNRPPEPTASVPDRPRLPSGIGPGSHNVWFTSGCRLVPPIVFTFLSGTFYLRKFLSARWLWVLFCLDGTAPGTSKRKRKFARWRQRKFLPASSRQLSSSDRSSGV